MIVCGLRRRWEEHNTVFTQKLDNLGTKTITLVEELAESFSKRRMTHLLPLLSLKFKKLLSRAESESAEGVDAAREGILENLLNGIDFALKDVEGSR